MAIVFFFLGATAQNVVPFSPEGIPVEKSQVVTQPTPCITNTNLVIVNPFAPTPKPTGKRTKPAPAPNCCCSQIWDLNKRICVIEDRLSKLENHPLAPAPSPDPNFGPGKDDTTPLQSSDSMVPIWAKNLLWWVLAALLVGGAIWALRWLFANHPTRSSSLYDSKESKSDRHEKLETKPIVSSPTVSDDVKIIEALRASGGYYHRYADGAIKIDVPKPAAPEVVATLTEKPVEEQNSVGGGKIQ